MRISDWSSDVCSSDLLLSMTAFTRIVVVLGLLRQALGTNQTPSNQILVGLAMLLSFFVMSPVLQKVYDEGAKPYMDGTMSFEPALAAGARPLRGFMLRSEEHTSELQSLMRTSY